MRRQVGHFLNLVIALLFLSLNPIAESFGRDKPYFSQADRENPGYHKSRPMEGAEAKAFGKCIDQSRNYLVQDGSYVYRGRDLSGQPLEYIIKASLPKDNQSDFVFENLDGSKNSSGFMVRCSAPESYPNNSWTCTAYCSNRWLDEYCDNGVSLIKGFLCVAGQMNRIR